MIPGKRDREFDEQLDRLGSEIIRASAGSETDAASVASSPFLYTRLRSRIADERNRREAGESWLAMLGVLWRTVPAMAIVAFIALALFLSAGTGTIAPGSVNYEGLLNEEQMVLADRQLSSSDEVLATLLEEDEQGASR